MSDIDPEKPQQQRQQTQLQQQQQQRLAAGEQKSTAPLKLEDSFLGKYVPASKSYDENLTSTGAVRPHWEQLNRRLSRVENADLDRRWRQIRSMVHQNGIAYSSYGDPGSREKHLQLDPLPHVLPTDQWDTIAASLKQRATLLNLVLADLYGPRTLISRGLLPPQALFGHPHYQLPYHDLPTAGDRHLHLYGVELMRSTSGGWWVMSDRTDSPGGCGFALENRLVISRAFPNEFRRCNVQRLAQYFIALREHLISLSPRKQENPQIALLSAGIGSASYFEDSYLARYLGFTLVEANDLVVRAGRVMLKTLAGLTQIDVILRRQQGNQIDPLEMGGNSPGVAGILQAVREGNVAIASAPGSGLVESPIFMAFMPRICQELMQEKLLMPGVATWWGGEPASLERIKDKIDDLVLMPAFRHRTILGLPPHAHKLLDPQSFTREERLRLVSDHPHEWVGQELVERPSAAVWENGSLRSGFLSMRAFLVAEGDSWHCMPGGLCRVSPTAEEPIQNPFEGGGTKDIWVLADRPVEQATLLKPSGSTVVASRVGGFLPSRVADNLCWLGRYLERADAAARLLRAVLTRLTGEIDPAGAVELPVLIRTMAVEGHIDAWFAVNEISQQLPEMDRRLAASALDITDPNSVRSIVDQIARLASRVRERLSGDAWRVVRAINGGFDACDPQRCDLADLLEMTNKLVTDLASFSGLVSETMTRTHAFRFLNIGRRLEHSLQIVTLLRHCFGREEPVPTELLETVLEVSDSIMTYRSRYYDNMQLATVLDLLLADEMNPRSLAYQLVALNANLESLPGNSEYGTHPPERRLAMDALHSVRMAEFSSICELHAIGEPQPLLSLLEKVEDQLPKVSTAISNRFLVHSGPVHQLVTDKFGRPR